MPRFLPEPALPFEQQHKTAVVLMNLGTPDAPTPEAVRPYLRDFLSDPRVVELPKWLWQPVLHGAVLRVRPKQSAHGYEKIWLENGSPLAAFTRLQAQELQGRLNGVEVCHAMSYGNPGVAPTLAALKARGVAKLLVVPLYPQYAASSTGAALDKVFDVLSHQRNQMELRTVARFYADAGYIGAMKRHIEAYWAEHGRGGRLMLSFHGVPQKNIDDGDPYLYECRQTSALLASALGLSPDEWLLSFQSRFGKAKWIEPSTQELLDRLPGEGTDSLDVFCPGFIADCLETLEEIALAGREQFHAAGGRQYRYIPCLNDSPYWIDALENLVRRHLQGWE